MCCDSRGLVQGKTLSEEELNEILNDINKCSLIKTIGITGGEPMLYPELIEQIMQFKFNREIKIGLKTNGFWGKNKNYANEIIKKYSQKISYISLSYDEFHMPFIDVECLKNIILTAKDYNISSDVVGCFLKNRKSPGDILNLLGESAYYTKFCYQPVIETGSGKTFARDSYIKLLDTNKNDIYCISTIETDLLINPNLDVYPCCSQVIENTILKAGNLKENNLNDIISSIKHNYIFNTIFTQGFTPFIQFLSKNGIDYPLNIASPCELCEFLFKNDWFMKKLMDEHYYESIGQ